MELSGVKVKCQDFIIGIKACLGCKKITKQRYRT